MLFLACDDEPLQLERLCDAIREADSSAEIVSFSNPLLAKMWINVNSPDAAFLDIEMPGISGTILGKLLKERNPSVNIIFVTAYPQYAPLAFEMRASGYIQKPVNARKVLAELNDLRYPMPVPANKAKKLKVTCFGTFEAFADEQPIPFKRSKTLELLAYLIDRKGARATTGEICCALLEDGDDIKNKSYLRHLVSDLCSTLASLGLDDVVVKNVNAYSIRPELISCDYYDYLKNEPYAIKSFFGEYMSRYSWAELTLGELLRKNSEK